MAKTEKLGLNTWGETDNSGTWLAWRLAMAGTSDDSNMMILDAWAKTMEEQIANVQSTLTFDDTPTEGSENPVTSGGIKTALDKKQNELSFDEAPTAGSSNPITSGGVYDALQAHSSKPDLTIHCAFGDTSSAAACQSSAVFTYEAAEVQATYAKLTAADEQPVIVSVYGEVKKGSSVECYTMSVTDVSSSDEQLCVSFLLTPSLIEGLEHVFHAELTLSTSGGQVTSSFYVEPIDGTTDITLDDAPTEGSENLVTSGGVWEALESKATTEALQSHIEDSTGHVTAEERSVWDEKQNQITATGILKGDGSGGVAMAVAGSDYAPADHDHDGVYCTTAELEEALESKAPIFSPVQEVDLTSESSFNITAESNGKTYIVFTGTASGTVNMVIADDDTIPVGAECEIIWADGSRQLCIQPSSCVLHHTLSTDSSVSVKLSSGMSVAVLKKIAESRWLVSGDIKL